MAAVSGAVSSWQVNYCEHHDVDCVEGIVSVFLHDSTVRVHVCPFHYQKYNV